MNVKNLCLAILFECDATGYEIRKKSTEGEFSYFIDASFGSIYPALAKLEEDGLVTARVETQEGRPAKKVYALTEAGREAFLHSLYDDLSEDVFRSPFMMFARYVEHLPQALVEQRAKEKLARTERVRHELEKMREKFKCPADQWIIDMGLAVQAVAEDYLRNHMHELIGLGRRDDKRDAAE